MRRGRPISESRMDAAALELLDRVGASVLVLAHAEEEYEASLLAALDAGASYSAVARAAGVRRQTIHEFAAKARREA